MRLMTGTKSLGNGNYSYYIWKIDGQPLEPTLENIQEIVRRFNTFEDQDRDGCQLCYGANGGVPGNENVTSDGLTVCDFCMVKLRPLLGSSRPVMHGHGRFAEPSNKSIGETNAHRPTR